MKQTVIAVDFDGVINDRKGKEFGPPIPGAIEALDDMADAGLKVIVHTCVAATPAGRQAVIDWLDDHDATYVDVTAVKPVARLYLDDRAMKFTNWDDATRDIIRMYGVRDD